MSQLFAFNNAEDLLVTEVPAGRYDATQQLWIADDASYGDMIEPAIEKTMLSTLGLTGTPSDPDFIYDLKID